MRTTSILFIVIIALLSQSAFGAEALVIRSAHSGAWSSPDTWEGKQQPSAGARVLIRRGDAIVYDVVSNRPIRSIHIAGRLSFARDRDTRLDVGLIMIQNGEETSESGFDCNGLHGPPRQAQDGADTGPQAGADDTHAQAVSATSAALEVGTDAEPIPAGHTALIRLTWFEGADKDSLPAIVCCGGRMDFHGAPLPHTWTRLGRPVKKGESEITLLDAVTGWRAGDRIIVTATTRQNKKEKTFRTSTRDDTQTEERVIVAVDGSKLTVDRPCAFDHAAEGNYRGDVANLSRNVIIESADPAKARGHTMYHRNSTGSISYAEFRHLGKEGVLGRYSLHFHLAGDSMRGSSVIGASIWDSGNRWITIHGTNYLVVRDCVGYQSVGHGFFLENGTEVYNVLDHNLAVQAYAGKKLPDQALPYDENDGSGFWWANSLNAFTRNVAAECDEYGYFFQAIDSPQFHLNFAVRQPDGSKSQTDVRKVPFLRFDDNESNCQRRHGFNLGGGVPFGSGVDGVGPDAQHPFVIRNFRVWNSHWSIHPCSPSVLIDGLDIHSCEYGIWRPVYDHHAYRNTHIDGIAVSAEFMPKGQRPVESEYPRPLEPADDLPPVTVITSVIAKGNQLYVRGTTSDNGAVKSVTVNGTPATATRQNFAEWEAMLGGSKPGKISLIAGAQDAAGNVEKTPHVRMEEMGSTP
jgi:hypothetical protein